MGIVLGIIGLVVIWSMIAAYLRKRRRDKLLEKYGDIDLVNDIMAGKIWQGMSWNQLVDSWGHPVDIGKKVYKTKTTETFKYNQTGKNRFGSRVILENGIVVGWQQK